MKLKGAVSHVVEVEWMKYTLIFLREGPFFFNTSTTFNDLNRHLVHVEACFKHETPSSLKSDVDRQTN